MSSTGEKPKNLVRQRIFITVAVIVASYGPFTLGMVLGLVALFLMIFTTKTNQKKMAFNIKETVLDASDNTGFSRLIRELIFSEYLDVFHLERYRHRLSMEGLPLFYYALVGRKAGEIPGDFLERHEIGE